MSVLTIRRYQAEPRRKYHPTLARRQPAFKRFASSNFPFTNITLHQKGPIHERAHVRGEKHAVYRHGVSGLYSRYSVYTLPSKRFLLFNPINLILLMIFALTFFSYQKVRMIRSLYLFYSSNLVFSSTIICLFLFMVFSWQILRDHSKFWKN